MAVPIFVFLKISNSVRAPEKLPQQTSTISRIKKVFTMGGWVKPNNGNARSLEAPDLTTHPRGTGSGRRYSRFSCAEVAQECRPPCPTLPPGAGRLHQGESLWS